MHPYRERLELMDRVVLGSVRAGLGGMYVEDDQSRGRWIRIDGEDRVNLASCSYLGLELDPRLAAAAIEAVCAHGVQFSSSRIYLSHPLYEEADALMERVFDAPVLLTTTTTLGHFTSLPVLVDPEDVILLDHQVHSSVQMASRYTSSYGVRVETLPHNDLARLEERVSMLAPDCRAVWYMADGVYSMFGDRAPVAEIVEMLDRHPSMHFYVDDAHGMSWCGPRGAGTVLDRGSLHPRMVMATGLGKGFGVGGGALVFPDEETRDRVRRCGPAFNFGGPLQPPVVGAMAASARIHLSDEIETLQAELRERIAHVHEAFAAHDLPLVSPPDTPVGYLGTGEIEVCRALVARVQADGFFVNPAHFPAAPVDRAGLRFLVTRFGELEDYAGLAESCARHWETAVRETGRHPEEIWERFGLTPSRRSPGAARHAPPSILTVERASSIDKMDALFWDESVGTRGCLAAGALRVFEEAFGPGASPENRWTFRYFVVRDEGGAPVLATLFTGAIWKADLLSPAAVSAEIEVRRAANPLHLTQRVFAQGCLLSEGDQLWLREEPETAVSRAAIAALVEAVRAEADLMDADLVVFRDVPQSAESVRQAYEEAGLLCAPGPVGYVVDPVPPSREALVATLGRDHRRHHRLSVDPFESAYAEELIGLEGRPLREGELERLRLLYERVRERNLDLNTYPLPDGFFEAAATSPGWEIVALRPAEGLDEEIVGFFVALDGPSGYVPLVAGLDYAYVRSRGLYRQLLRRVLDRAIEKGASRIRLGFGADLEKRRFGGRPEPALFYVEVRDTAAMESVAEVEDSLS